MDAWLPLSTGSRPGSERSPSRPRWPWTRRRARSRPRAGRSSRSAPASPTSRPPTTSSRPRSGPAPSRGSTSTPPRQACPSCGRRSRRRPGDSGYEVAASQVIVTAGGKHAVYEAFATLLDPGDEVLLPTPYWTTYPEAIALAGGTPVTVMTDETSGYLTSVADLEAHRTDAAKVLLFVSPSNPTGAVYPPELVAEIGRWAADTGLWVVTDEIYEHLVYGDARFSSIPVAAPGIADRCVVLNGVAKTYAMTGWRVGWLIGPPDVAKAAADLQSHMTSNICNVAQAAALAAVSGDLSAVARMRDAFDRRRRQMTAMLNEIPGVICPLPEGAFYCYPSVKGVLGREIAGRRPASTAELAELLLEEVDVAVVPGEAFGTPGYFRLSCALGDADLEEGISRIGKLLGGAR